MLVIICARICVGGLIGFFASTRRVFSLSVSRAISSRDFGPTGFSPSPARHRFTKEEAKQYKAWCETQAVVARRYESMLLRSRGLVAQLVPKLAGKVLLSWAKDDEVEWDHARILARYTNALLAKRIAIRETGPGTLPLTSYFTAPRT